jgi:hypothetical protein
MVFQKKRSRSWRVISVGRSLLRRDITHHTPVTLQVQERLTRDIQSTDREIDRLVYELYGLPEDEIKIVEGG